MKPVSLYIHIPFCTTKCHYCSFNSITGKSRFMGRYVEMLVREIKFYQEQLKGRTIPTIFMGGGTPSLLSAEQVNEILDAARSNFNVDEKAEITLESNPGTLNLEKLVCYKEAGVNRISLGVQSFQKEELRWLGRTHGVDEVLNSVSAIKEAGFKNFNLDLIFGLPDQTLAHWQENVHRALDLSPTHISLYHLTIEEGSTFHDYKHLPDPSDEEGAKLFNWTKVCLEGAGFAQYEISNYARPGYRCRHNEVYWRNEDCVGIGAGAWTYFNGSRFLRPKTIETYVADVEEEKFSRLEEENLEIGAALRETLVFGLRTKEGVDLSRLKSRFGTGPDPETESAIARLQDQGLLQLEKDQLSITRKGLLFADSIAVELI